MLRHINKDNVTKLKVELVFGVIVINNVSRRRLRTVEINSRYVGENGLNFVQSYFRHAFSLIRT